MDDAHALLDRLLQQRGGDEPDSSDDRPAAYSDDALALRFTKRHGDDLRFIGAFGRWFIWNGM